MPSDTPNIIYGGQVDYKSIFYSEENNALTIPVSLIAGYGVLKAGTALAVTDTAGGNYLKYFPYEPTAKTGAEYAPGRMYLVSDGDGTTTIYLTISDSYKFIVGDTLDVIDANSSVADLGLVVSIDRTTYSNRAAVVVTNACTSSYTTAQFAHVMISGATTYIGILMKSVDTGTGSSAAGALAAMVLSNALLYTGMLSCVDSDARTDLGASTISQYTKLP